MQQQESSPPRPLTSEQQDREINALLSKSRAALSRAQEWQAKRPLEKRADRGQVDRPAPPSGLPPRPSPPSGAGSAADAEQRQIEAAIDRCIPAAQRNPFWAKVPSPG